MFLSGHKLHCITAKILSSLESRNICLRFSDSGLKLTYGKLFEYVKFEVTLRVVYCFSVDRFTRTMRRDQITTSYCKLQEKVPLVQLKRHTELYLWNYILIKTKILVQLKNFEK